MSDSDDRPDARINFSFSAEVWHNYCHMHNHTASIQQDMSLEPAEMSVSSPCTYCK